MGRSQPCLAPAHPREESSRVNIILRGKNVEVTPSFKEHAEKQVQKLTRLLDNIDDVLVTQSIQRNWHTVDVTVQARRMIFRAEERSTDMYASLDMCLDKLERQTKRFRDRLQRKNQRSATRPEEAASAMGAETESQDEAAPTDTPQIVRTKRFNLKPVTPEEAMLQLEMVGHDFFVFLNADTQSVNVLYRRHDGNYGLIEPDA